MLVETHSWKTIRTRVRVTRNTIVSVMTRMAASGSQWLTVAAEADKRAVHLAGQSVPLDYKASPSSHHLVSRL